MSETNDNETEKSPRTWSTRTLAAAAVAALVIGGGGGAALGAISNGADSGGPGGRGNFRQLPDGRQGQGPQGGPGMMPPQGTMPSTPPDPTTKSSSTVPDDDEI